MHKDNGASSGEDRATAVEPVPVSPLRDGIPSADYVAQLERAIINERADHAARLSGVLKSVDHYDLLASGYRQALEWRPLTDIAWLDGRDLVLLAYDMEVQARYCAGEWSADTPINPAEYDGAVWSCFDDQFQIEIEEIGHDPVEWHHGQATHWRDLTPRPAQGMETREGGDGEAAPSRSDDSPVRKDAPHD